MSTQRASLAILVAFSKLLSIAYTSCHNDCYMHGTCTNWGECACFSGWTGNDCSLRTCPVGSSLAGIPNDTDSAHTMAVCSGRGSCDYASGTCECYFGFFGNNCGSMYCMNNCNGRGRCLGIKDIPFVPEYLDGISATYNRWDGNFFHGCICDRGWAGADCSQQLCESGIDPRQLTTALKSVIFVCECNPSCNGKFKLKSSVQRISKWLYSTSTAEDMANALTAISGTFTTNTASLSSTITAFVINGTVKDSVCKDNANTKTVITFSGRGIIQPELSLYANLVHGGTLSFENDRLFRCDCASGKSCNGTFRLSFYGEISDKISTFGNFGKIVNALRNMQAVKSGNVYVSSATSTSAPICSFGQVKNHSLVMNASFGHLPQIELWMSWRAEKAGTFYMSSNVSSVLTVSSGSSRSEINAKLCSGIGSCDFETSVCSCPFGWGSDAVLGPCARLVMNTSKWNGLGRCPGVIDPGDLSNPVDLSGRQNYPTRLFVAMNPSYRRVEGQSENSTSNATSSSIEYYDWIEDSRLPWPGPHVEAASRKFFLNLTSNGSAGPLLVDEAKGRLFFIDQHPTSPYIGRVSLRGSSKAATASDVWLRLNGSVFGFTMDAHFARRKLYWTMPGALGVADGGIFWAYMDDTAPATVHSLTAVIGQQGLVDPMGIAVHLYQQRLYWVDRNISENTTALHSCDFDGYEHKQVFLYRNIYNRTTFVNATDLVIDFSHNNTVFLIDEGYPEAIVATNLVYPVYNDTGAGIRFSDMEPVRLLTFTVAQTNGRPSYLTIDERINSLLWSDPALERIEFLRYIYRYGDPYSRGNVYTPLATLSGSASVTKSVNIPVGIAFDRGLGEPSWGAYLDCYGNGRCTGLDGNWICECFKGFYGNCQERSCPKGPAWWSVPIVDGIAHDVLVECSNMGRCDRKTGQCVCRPGFEGSSCSRMSCQGQTDNFSTCNGKGRCLSMRELAAKRVSADLSPSPVVYGSKPHDPLTWDADMIYSCYGDQYGYSSATGYSNISQYVGQRSDELECPYGYDARILDNIYGGTNQANYTARTEVQVLYCSASYGHFVLEFRGVISANIQANSSLAHFRTILGGMSTVGEVALQQLGSVQSGTVCSQAGQSMNITLTAQLGDVPILTVITNDLDGGAGTVSVLRQQKGQGPLKECAGRGQCDRSSGTCRCWDNWGSSDGFGDKGYRGDCGHSLIY